MIGSGSSMAVSFGPVSLLPPKKRKHQDGDAPEASSSKASSDRTEKPEAADATNKSEEAADAIEQLKELLEGGKGEEAEASMARVSRKALPASSVVNFPAHLSHYIRLVKNRDSLKESGVSCAKSLLITGPAGSGKSEVAYSIASEAGIDVIPLDAANAEQALSAVAAMAEAGESALVLIEDIDIFKDGARALLKIGKLPGMFLVAVSTDSAVTIDPDVVRGFGWQAEMPQHTPYSIKQVLWSRLSQLENIDLNREDVEALELPHGVDASGLDNIIALALSETKEAGEERVRLADLKQAISTFSDIPKLASQRAMQHLYS